jgi:Tol biopolymer transport system component
MSPDGRYITYSTLATNPFDGITCQEPCSAVFLWDRKTNTQERISVNSQGENANNTSAYGTLSDDGRYILFVSDATNFVQPTAICHDDVNGDYPCLNFYVRDRHNHTTRRVNFDENGNLDLNAGAIATYVNFDISSDGHYVTFTGGRNPDNIDIDHVVYVRDIIKGKTEIASVDSDGALMLDSNGSGSQAISRDGRFVTFVGSDNLLYVRDRLQKSTRLASQDADGHTGTVAHRRNIVDFNSTAMTDNGFTIVFISDSDTLAGSTPGDFTEKLFVSEGTPLTGEILLNGDFEQGTSNPKIPKKWDLDSSSGAARKCNDDKIVAHGGECAFQIKGLTGGSTKLDQSSFSLWNSSGDTLTLSAWVEGKKLDGARVQAKIIYTDDSVTKLRLSETDLNAGTYAYKQLTASVPLGGEVDKVKVQITLQDGHGRLRIDDVSLNLTPASAAALVPLPIQP